MADIVSVLDNKIPENWVMTKLSSIVGFRSKRSSSFSLGAFGWISNQKRRCGRKSGSSRDAGITAPFLVSGAHVSKGLHSFLQVFQTPIAVNDNLSRIESDL